MGKRGLGLLISAGALLLSGCTNQLVNSRTEPVLVVNSRPGFPTVTASVIGGKADVFRWDWGDGAVVENMSDTASHTYASLGVYTITVTLFRRGSSGDGAPGPGKGTTLVPVKTLATVVDLRLSVEITGIHVQVVAPPPWYNPNTWPPDSYPAACTLELRPIFEFRRAAPAVKEVVWNVFRDGRIVMQCHAEVCVIPYDVFLCDCQTPKTPYDIHVVAFLSDGTAVQYKKTIYACPPRGCR